MHRFAPTLAILLAASPALAQTFFAVDFETNPDGELIRIESDGSVTLIGALNPPESIEATELAMRDGKLYTAVRETVSTEYKIFEVNQVTGSVMGLGVTVVPDGFPSPGSNFFHFRYDPSTDEFCVVYASGSDALLGNAIGVVDIATGLVTPRLNTSPAFDMDSMDFLEDGRIFAWNYLAGPSQQEYAVISPNGSVLTLFPPTPWLMLTRATRGNGVVWASDRQGDLASIDPQSGVVTLDAIDVQGDRDLKGLVMISDLCSGDIDGNNTVDLADFNILGVNFGAGPGATYTQGDLNGDSFVDLADFNILGVNFGNSCP